MSGETNHSQLELLAHPMKAGRRRDSLSTVKTMASIDSFVRACPLNLG